MAINSTYRALSKAGFNRANFPRLQEVMFITESEAAAHYVARFYRDERGQEFLKVSWHHLESNLALTSHRKISTSCFVMPAAVPW